MEKPNYELQFACLLEEHGIFSTLEVVLPHRGPKRWKPRFDVAIGETPEQVGEFKMAAEIHGGIFIMGRHNRPFGIKKDCRKMTLAALEGWSLFACVPQDMEIVATLMASTFIERHGLPERIWGKR